MRLWSPNRRQRQPWHGSSCMFYRLRPNCVIQHDQRYHAPLSFKSRDSTNQRTSRSTSFGRQKTRRPDNDSVARGSSSAVWDAIENEQSPNFVEDRETYSRFFAEVFCYRNVCIA